MSGTEKDEMDSPEAPVPPPLPAPLPASMSAPIPPVSSKPRRAVWPVVFALGFVLLAGGEAYLWNEAQRHRADATELAVLRAQLDDLRMAAARPVPDNTATQAATQAGLAQQYANLTAQVNVVQAQSASDHAALALVQADSTNLGALTQRMTLLNALETARLALDAGQPLGQVPGAPQALAQFAATAPPTLAQLRQSFAPAARAAEAASLSTNGGTGFWARTKLRLEGLITISDGTHVIFGPPAAAALGLARQALDNGDLAGAVAALQGMSPAASQAMGSWLPQAEALLAARAAIATMAKGG
ncbi:hypothetical protein [Acidocella sp.]|uniref:hypothetical protein n=1 Tax=Acidocella sp. TaxID=50710 RepID=UPI00260DE7F8|nr:hypothetical protein [Acidocella sp.]